MQSLDRPSFYLAGYSQSICHYLAISFSLAFELLLHNNSDLRSVRLMKYLFLVALRMPLQDTAIFIIIP